MNEKVNIKVLLVTNMYPDKKHPYYGIFVSEQVDAVKRNFPVDYDILFIDGQTDKLAYLKSILLIKRKIDNNKYDLIHIHYGLSGLFLLSMWKKKIPIVITLHGGDIQAEQGKRFQVYLTKKILKHVDVAIVLNNKMKSIVKDYAKFTEKIPCSVNTDLFVAPERIESDIKSKKIIVFPSDKRRTVKNYPLFAQTLAVLREKYDMDCEEVELRDLTRRQVSELYQKADVMLMTSISEGSPQAVKEAMACNLAVVSTKVGDVDYLLEGVAGSAVVDTFSCERLAEQVYLSLIGRIKGISGREKLLRLQLDDKSIACKIYETYTHLLFCH